MAGCPVTDQLRCQEALVAPVRLATMVTRRVSFRLQVGAADTRTLPLFDAPTAFALVVVRNPHQALLRRRGTVRPARRHSARTLLTCPSVRTERTKFVRSPTGTPPE